MVTSDANGNEIGLSAEEGDNNVFIASAKDTYSCCAACFQTSECGTYDFVPGYGSQPCGLDLCNQCPAGQTPIGLVYESGNYNNPVVGTVPCEKVPCGGVYQG
jgi:hypothetical protein